MDEAGPKEKEHSAVPAPDEPAGDAQDGDDETAASDGEQAGQSTPTVGKKGKGKGKGRASSQDAPTARRTFNLAQHHEEDLYAWLPENESVWRMSHKDYKKRRQVWQSKADLMGLECDLIMGWYKSRKDWYVRLMKPAKSGSAAKKKMTDREKELVKNFAFYSKAMKSSQPSPLVVLQRSTSQASSQPIPNTPEDEDVHTPDSPSPIQEQYDLEELESAAVASRDRHQSRSHSKSSRNKKGEDSEMMALMSIMKTNQELLQTMVGEKPTHPEREPFITYLSDTLRQAQAEKYKVMKTSIMRMLERVMTEEEPPRPAQASSAPPSQFQYDYDIQYQQQQHQPRFFQQPPQSHFTGGLFPQTQQQHHPLQQTQQQHFPLPSAAAGSAAQAPATDTLTAGDTDSQRRESANLSDVLGNASSVLNFSLDSTLASHDSNLTLNTPPNPHESMIQ